MATATYTWPNDETSTEIGRLVATSGVVSYRENATIGAGPTADGSDPNITRGFRQVNLVTLGLVPGDTITAITLAHEFADGNGGACQYVGANSTSVTISGSDQSLFDALVGSTYQDTPIITGGDAFVTDMNAACIAAMQGAVDASRAYFLMGFVAVDETSGARAEESEYAGSMLTVTYTPAAPTSAVKTLMGVAHADIKSISGITIANVKTVNGI